MNHPNYGLFLYVTTRVTQVQGNYKLGELTKMSVTPQFHQLVRFHY